MEERVRPTRTGLFSIEMTIAIGIFTLCASICIGLFIHSEIMSRQDADTIRAISAARSLSECYKAAGGDLRETAELSGGSLESDGVVLLFDGDWQKCAEEGEQVLFHLILEPSEDNAVEGVLSAKVTATGEKGETLVSWEVSAWEEAL